MTLLGYDGFEGIESADAALRGWTLIAGGVGAAAGFLSGGINGRRLYLESGGVNGFAQSSARIDIVGVDEVVFGAAVRVESTNSSVVTGVMQFAEGGTAHVTVGASDTGQLIAYRGNTDGTSLGSSGTGLFAEGSWIYLEARVKVSDTLGEVELFLEGESVLSLTGLDTKNGGTGVIDRLLFVASTPSGLSLRGVVSFDDAYWLDTAGSAPYNAPLGPVRVDQLLLASDVSTDFTPSAGTDNFAMLDEALPDGDATYVESGTSGHKDIFTLADLATPSGTIFGVTLRTRARRTDAGPTSLIPSIISDASEGDGATMVLGANYSEQSDLYTLDPDGNVPWTDSAVNALQAAFRNP